MEERLQILKMVQEGKISAEEAEKLLKAVDEQPSASLTGGSAKWLRVRVLDLDSNKAKVNVNLPMGLLEVALNLGMKFIPDNEQLKGIDFQQLFEAIKQGAIGKLVEVEDDDEGVRVEVIVE